MIRLFLALFIIVPLIFVGVGGSLVWSQHHKITTFVPVTATVISTDIKVHESTDSDGHPSTSYEPIVNYRYQVDGRTYECNEVIPLGGSGPHSWARELVNRFQQGQEVDAFYDPADPTEAFLVREYSFLPYIFLLFPMLFLSVAAGIGLGTSLATRGVPEPTPATGGWFELRPQKRIRDLRKAFLLIATSWHIVGVLVWGHYFRVAEPPYGLTAWIVTCIYEGLGLVPVILFGYYFRLGRIVSDADVAIDRQEVRLGDELVVNVQQDVFTPLHVAVQEIALVCEETIKRRSGSKTTISSHTCYEDRAALVQDRDVRAGDILSGQHTLRVPDDREPSSPPGQKSYPKYAWRLELSTKITGQPDYNANFRLNVQPSRQEPSETRP